MASDDLTYYDDDAKVGSDDVNTYCDDVSVNCGKTTVGHNETACSGSKTQISATKSRRLSYKFKTKRTSIADELCSLRNREAYTDIILKAGHIKLRCHKVVLLAASPKFETYFKISSKRSSPEQVEINNVKPSILEAIVNYIYDAQIDINTDNVQEISQTCALLELKELQAACDQFMAENIQPYNCFGFFKHAKIHNLKKAYDAALKCMLTQLEDILRLALDHEYKALSEKALIEYISSDDLEVDDEEKVFKLVEKWVRANQEARESSIDKVLQYVRLPLCSASFLCNIVPKSVLYRPQSKRNQELIHEAKDCHLLPDKRKALPSIRTKPRKKTAAADVVIIGGGERGETGNYTCFRLKDSHNESLDTLTYLPGGHPWYCAVCLLDNDILVTGGSQNDNLTDGTKRCWAYSLSDKRWELLPPMLRARAYHNVVAIGQEVLAIGGFHRGPLMSMEKLDSDRHGWSMLAPMQHVKYRGHSFHIGDSIYVLGGYDTLLTQVYNISSNTWMTRSPMPRACHTGSAAMLNGYIYLVGGSEQNSMRYDPKLDQWVSISRPDHHCPHPTAVNFQGKVLLGGGQSSRNRTDVEEYDPETDRWSLWRINLPCDLRGHSMLIM